MLNSSYLKKITISLFGIVLFIICFCNFFIREVNAFSIHIGSYESDGSFSVYNNVYMIIVDPIGRETGYNPFTNKWSREIPNSGSGSDSIGDDESGTEGPADFGVEIFGDNIDIGEYKIKIFGLKDTKYLIEGPFEKYVGYITSGSISTISFNFDPTPGAPPPTITKIVTFQTLRDDFNVAQKLNQIGDDKFVNSLIKMVDIAEKLYNRCQQIKDGSKEDKHKRLCYRPVIMILELIKKRLEIVNRICDNPNGCKSKCKLKDECDEEKAFDNFRKENIKEEGIKEFFSEWDKDEWHKHKKMCKKFITDEALKIISEDIDWLIKSLDGNKDKLKDKLDKDEIKDLKSEK